MTPGTRTPRGPADLAVGFSMPFLLLCACGYRRGPPSAGGISGDDRSYMGGPALSTDGRSYSGMSAAQVPGPVSPMAGGVPGQMLPSMGNTAGSGGGRGPRNQNTGRQRLRGWLDYRVSSADLTSRI